MAQLNSLVLELRKNHQKLASMISFCQEALETGDGKKEREALSKLCEVAKGHFRFERNYLYPRVRRLTFQVLEKLSEDQDRINQLMEGAKPPLNRLNKRKPSGLSGILPAVSRHLEDCDDLIFLANKFSKEEEGELSQRLKECCRIKI